MPVRPYRPSLAKARYMVQNSVVESSPPEAIAARSSFAEFRRYVCGHQTYPHHEVWEDALITGKDSKCLRGIGGQDLLILAPRGSTKSTYTTEFVAWIIGKHTAPDVKLPIKILYISYTIDVAMLKSVEIKQIIESDKFQKVFPWCRPSDRWSDKLWSIDRSWAGLPVLGEPYTLACTGLKGTATGKRAHLLVIDDLLKSSEQVESLIVREKLQRNWTEVVNPVRFEGARAICIGTRMSSQDIYATDFTPEKKWQVLVQSAIVEDERGYEKSYWEEGQSLKFLQETRDKNPTSFSFQFLNKIVRVSEQSIDPKWIVYEEIPDIEEYEMLAMGLDLSASIKDRADFTVLTLCGRIGSKFYVIDMRRMRSISNIEKLDAIIELWRDWGEPRIDLFTEDVAYQASLAGDFVHHVVNTNRIFDITCTPVKPKGDKLARLRANTGLFSNGLVIFNKFANLNRLVYELVNWGSLDHDDGVDSLNLALQGLRSRRRLEIT